MLTMVVMSGSALTSCRAIDMKTCNKCNKTKPFSLFHKHSGFKDGLRTVCKECRKNEHIVRYENNKDEWNQRSVKWQKTNKEKVAHIQKTYRDANKEQRNNQTAEWKRNNKAKVNFSNNTRHAAKLQRTPEWLSKEQLQEIQDFYAMAQQLETVFPWKQHVDHIVPLQGEDVSGLHLPWNLQILSAKDNITKGNRYNG
jgi:hypothetical protein